MKTAKGFSLIELIMAMVILGIALFPLLKLFGDMTVMGNNPEDTMSQSMLAQELLEEIKSHRFDELVDVDGSGNWSSSLGVEGAEVSTNKSTFDDVDDFNGFTEVMASPFTGYTRTVSVGYVAGNDLDTVLAIPSPITNDWTPNFKRIAVTVSSSSGNTLTVSTVAGATMS